MATPLLKEKNIRMENNIETKKITIKTVDIFERLPKLIEFKFMEICIH